MVTQIAAMDNSKGIVKRMRNKEVNRRNEVSDNYIDQIWVQRLWKAIYCGRNIMVENKVD